MDLAKLTEDTVESSNFTASVTRRLTAAIRLMDHHATKMRQTASSPWRIDTGSTPVRSVAISHLPPIPAEAPPWSPTFAFPPQFHSAESPVSVAGSELEPEPEPEPEPVFVSPAQTSKTHGGKCAGLRL